ncbi:MAG TPA: nuclear transport factor 2 family protein [Gemmatimonas sp.]|nr:nuclear transport factor 2 family protein [Gemmatimonas sp.]
MKTLDMSAIGAGDYADVLSTIFLAEQSFDEGNFAVHESLLHTDFSFTSPFGSFTATSEYMTWLHTFYEYVTAQGGTRHAVTNPIVRLDGETATVHFYLLIFNRKSMTVMGTSTVVDVLQKRPDGWRFRSRTISTDQPPAA